MKNFFLILIVIIIPTGLISQILSPETVEIPMRDEAVLAADVYKPEPQAPRPTILIQTPYNKYYYRFGLPLGFGTDLNDCPYNFVIVDWRGFYASASAASASTNRGEDGYDVIEWISAQTWSDGMIGTWGPSALGKIQFETAREQHPNHICAVPLVATPEFLYQMYYPNGVYREEYVEQLDALGYGLSTILEQHPYYDFTWQYAENNAFYPELIQIPVLMIGGWFDHNVELIKYFNDLLENSPQDIASQHKLMMGPWAHGGSGQAQVGTEQQGDLLFPEAAGFSDNYARAFFDFHLLFAYNSWPMNPVVKYFQMGDMTWMDSDQWPIETENFDLFLHNDGILSDDVPENNNSFSDFTYDPRDPSPTIGGATLRNDLLQGPYDQSVEVESRNDLVIFETDYLQADFKIAGKPRVRLWVSSDRLDTDFAVRLCDVYPDGRSMILSDGIFRMRFRNGFTISDTAVIVPGEKYEIEIELPDIAQTFVQGHKIRLDITSSNYPRYNRNINNGGPLYSAGDTLIASNQIFHNADYPSKIIFPIIDIAQSSSMSLAANQICFPNPIQSGQIMQFDGVKAEQVEILEMTGRIVLVLPVNSDNTIRFPDLAAGIYFVRVYDLNQQVSTMKILVK
jgi:uncharacterized protein